MCRGLSQSRPDLPRTKLSLHYVTMHDRENVVVFQRSRIMLIDYKSGGRRPPYVLNNLFRLQLTLGPIHWLSSMMLHLL